MRASIVPGERFWMVLVLGALGACGEDDSGQGTDWDTSTGDAGADGVADTIPSEEIDGDTGHEDRCPLDPTARARVELIVQTAIQDAGWILSGTHGSGVFASRAFGLVIPATEFALLHAVTLAEACDAAKDFDPYCEGPLAGEPAEEGPTKCSQLKCLAAGELEAHLWLDGLPATFATTTGEGDLTLTALDGRAVTKELPGGDLDLTWTNTYTITYPDGLELAVSADGATMISGDEHDPAVKVTIAAGAWTLVIPIGSDEDGHSAGTGTIGGDEVVETHDGTYTWTGPCAPPL